MDNGRHSSVRRKRTLDLRTRFTVLIERRSTRRGFAEWLTRFTVLMERSAHRQRFVRLVAGALASVAALAAMPAQGRDHEVARDLDDAVNAPTTPSVHWARDVNGRRFVQVLV